MTETAVPTQKLSFTVSGGGFHGLIEVEADPEHMTTPKLIGLSLDVDENTDGFAECEESYLFLSAWFDAIENPDALDGAVEATSERSADVHLDGDNTMSYTIETEPETGDSMVFIEVLSVAKGHYDVGSLVPEPPVQKVPCTAPCAYGLAHYCDPDDVPATVSDLDTKQNVLTAGDNVSIDDDVISVPLETGDGIGVDTSGDAPSFYVKLADDAPGLEFDAEGGLKATASAGPSWSVPIQVDNLAPDISVVARLTDLQWRTSNGDVVVSSFNKKQLYGPEDLQNMKSSVTLSCCRREQWDTYEDQCDLSIKIWTSGTPSYPHTGSGGKYIHAVASGQAHVYLVTEVAAGLIGREMEVSGFGQADCNIRFFFEGTVTDGGFDYEFTGCLQAPESLTAGGDCLDHNVYIGQISENVGSVSFGVQPGFTDTDPAYVYAEYNLVSDSLHLFVTAEEQNSKTADEVLAIIASKFDKTYFDSDDDDGIRVIPMRMQCRLPLRGSATRSSV